MVFFILCGYLLLKRKNMKKIRLNESQLQELVKRTISEFFFEFEDEEDVKDKLRKIKSDVKHIIDFLQKGDVNEFFFEYDDDSKELTIKKLNKIVTIINEILNS